MESGDRHLRQIIRRTQKTQKAADDLDETVRVQRAVTAVDQLVGPGTGRLAPQCPLNHYRNGYLIHLVCLHVPARLAGPAAAMNRVQ
jgi:hypothetical protein